MTNDVDDLGVQHVTNQQQLVLFQRNLTAADQKPVQRSDVAQLDLGALKSGHGRPRHQIHDSATRADGQPVHHRMLDTEPGGEVAQLPDDTTVGSPHILTSLATEDQHERSLGQPVAVGPATRGAAPVAADEEVGVHVGP